jgi:hypothetical protein
MAEDRSNEATGAQGKAPSPGPLPDRARADAEAAASAIQGVISGGQVATPADHEAPPHTPDVSGGGDTSDAKARGKSLSETPPTFADWLHQQRQSLSAVIERVREELEPECP